MDSAQKFAINFHPGSPDYPGTGCYNFALYEQSKKYGVTCHHMNATVDTGNIIMTTHFDIAPYDTVESLKLKSMNHMLICLEKILARISQNQELPVSDEQWRRKPFTRKDLDKLCLIDLKTDSSFEMMLKIKATDYGKAVHGAYAEINGVRFYYNTADKSPII